ncbi:MAG: hypothetical protein ACP5US_10255 [Candidatus Kryptoniota bacterium]
MEALKEVLGELPDLDMVFQPTETGLRGFALGKSATYAVDISVEVPEKDKLPSELFKFNTTTLGRLLDLGGRISVSEEDLVIQNEDTVINWRKLNMENDDRIKEINLPEQRIEVELTQTMTEKIKKLSDVLVSNEYLFYVKDGMLHITVVGANKTAQNKANYNTGIPIKDMPPVRFDFVVTYALKSSVLVSFPTTEIVSPAKFVRKGNGWIINYYIMPLVDE